MITGSEANLLQCPHGGLGILCPLSYDAGVVCTDENLPGEDEWINNISVHTSSLISIL